MIKSLDNMIESYISSVEIERLITFKYIYPRLVPNHRFIYLGDYKPLRLALVILAPREDGESRAIYVETL